MRSSWTTTALLFCHIPISVAARLLQRAITTENCIGPTATYAATAIGVQSLREADVIYTTLAAVVVTSTITVLPLPAGTSGSISPSDISNDTHSPLESTDTVLDSGTGMSSGIELGGAADTSLPRPTGGFRGNHISRSKINTLASALRPSPLTSTYLSHSSSTVDIASSSPKAIDYHGSPGSQNGFEHSGHALNQAQHISRACFWSHDLAAANAIMPTYVGEWSAATNICVNPDGTTIAGTSCSAPGCQCQISDFGKLDDEMVKQMRMFVEAQLDVFEESSSGYFMWSAKGPGEWGYMNGIQKGVIPNLITSRSYSKQCGRSTKS